MASPPPPPPTNDGVGVLDNTSTGAAGFSFRQAITQILRRGWVGWRVRLVAPQQVVLGARVRFGRGVVLDATGGWIEIGPGVVMMDGAVVLAGDAELLARERPQGQRRDIRLGSRCWIGPDAIILPGVTLGSGAVVAARAVVTQDVEADTIVAGAPARRIGKSLQAHATLMFDAPASVPNPRRAETNPLPPPLA